ncbi:hypothetical protein HELRODRAFT_182311 [Helobdella robusta]|uniref:Uncharacterized protein n=1 Tax=Helobdella robusta TaxID=6412 RepID=T1FI15_HELRO|nr:hypothetical protein HELRODRAFT_182311 [Helobdella robusta]ESN91060.1 hypothetical protein HELRODRAFT_182311 [Helobdella robusta]
MLFVVHSYVVGSAQHPLVELEKLTNGNREMMDQKLLVWYYEDQLKKKYKSFIDALQLAIKNIQLNQFSLNLFENYGSGYYQISSVGFDESESFGSLNSLSKEWI